MTCHHPLRAYRTLKGAVTFKAQDSATGVSFKVPCSQCIGCRLEKARQWGLRCFHEAKCWPYSTFVTLTYSDEWLPAGGSLKPDDLELFIRKLRYSRKGKPVRYFFGGEYGDVTNRPHYHGILFNVHFADKKKFGESKGNDIFTSDELTKMWGMGHCTLGAVTYDSAVYCAKYTMKKVTGAAADEFYETYDAYGEVFIREREFAKMSRQPGLGYWYYQKYGDEVRNHDTIVIDGHQVKPPRYYDSLTERVDSKMLGYNKRKRKRLAVLNKADNTASRLRVKEYLAWRAAEWKEKKL